MSLNVTFTVGELKRLIGVEIPCFVKSTETSMNMLGGRETLQGVFESDAKSMQLRFPSKDQTRANILGHQVAKNGFLLKIRRKKISGSEEFQTEVEILGNVDKAYVFGFPADYQFLLF